MSTRIYYEVYNRGKKTFEYYTQLTSKNTRYPEPNILKFSERAWYASPVNGIDFIKCRSQYRESFSESELAWIYLTAKDTNEWRGPN